MKYKDKVTKRFPNAEPIVMEQWPDGSPRRVVIHADGQRLTTHTRDQSFKAAWRDAYYWCVRHPLPVDGAAIDAAIDRAAIEKSRSGI